ncbi:MAG: class I SAM-dependent methyltransferase [Methylocystis sp.]|nr:class I SAM-dependent methyltransferase [Methylocystis sp.]
MSSLPKQDTNFSYRSSTREKDARRAFVELYQNSPIPPHELVYSQLTLYLGRQELSRMLALSDIYRAHVVDTMGVMFEFGTCYGRTAALLSNFRGMFEPYNFTRKLVVFDTFGGLAGVKEKDGVHELARDGRYSAGQNYEEHLAAVLAYHESESPLAHIAKTEIVKGDATKTVPEYLKARPETIVSLAYFDFDIYGPTKTTLEALRPHLTKGSVLVFDQLNCPEYPGETLALADVFGLNRCNIRRSPLTPWMSYVVAKDLLD